ncbi:MAG: CvpA family protein [Acidobacteriaceae bacterium]|nr:CvpA family protein [Acidobacteriaceae bacterium]MBV9500232.1 CvpA family protein [Acidobacteriaceae bacterium]
MSTAFNWFDVVLALILVISATTGLRSGFARVTIGLFATVIGFLAGFWSYRMVAAEIVLRANLSPRAANILAFLLVLVAVMMCGALLAAVMARLFRWIGLSWFDHVLGGMAGFLRGVLVIAALADIVVAYSPSPMPLFLENSRVLPYATGVASTLADLAPQELKDLVHEQMQALRHLWAPKPVPHSSEI